MNVRALIVFVTDILLNETFIAIPDAPLEYGTPPTVREIIDTFVKDAFDVFIPAFVIIVLPFAMVLNDILASDEFDTFIYAVSPIEIFVNVATEGYVMVDPHEIKIPFVVLDAL